MPLCIAPHPCVRPERATSLTILHERSGPINGGDICAISASVKHPFLALFIGDDKGKTLCTKQTKVDFNFLQEHPEAGKVRPCLVVDYRDEADLQAEPTDDQWRPSVCLMGTFSNCTDLRQMSRILQHFLVPVSPTLGLTKTHFHTTPDWISDGPQYIIAFPMAVPPDRPLIKRWSRFSPVENPGSYYVPRHEVMEWKIYCTTLHQAWLELDIETKRKAQFEFKVSGAPRLLHGLFKIS